MQRKKIRDSGDEIRSYYYFIESFNVFKNAIKGRALDEFLSH